MADKLGRAAILSTVVICGVGLLVVVVTPRVTPAECDRVGLKGEERLSPTGQAEWFDGQCWTTTPQPPRDMSIAPLYRTPPGQPKPLPSTR